MFVHHVFFWLNDGLSSHDIDQFETGMRLLLQIEHVQQGDIGKPTGTNRKDIERTYNYSLLLLFNSKNEHALYQPHPVHRAFINNFNHLWKRVLIFDSDSIL